MKVNVSATLNGQEVIDEYFIPKIKESGVVVNVGEVTIFVKSEKTPDKLIEIKPENLQLVFKRGE